MYELDARFERLTRLDHIERAAHDRTLHALLSELDGEISALGTDPRTEVLRAIRKALRVDLAFLVEHPEATCTCLYYRLSGSSVPQARGWRAQRDGHGTPWIRSLRPPEHPLEGALIEEYRADAPQYQRRLRFDADAQVVELAYPCKDARPADTYAPRAYHRIAWNRVTGVSLERGTIQLRHPDVSPDGRLRIVCRSWGHAHVYAQSSGASLAELPLDRRYIAGSIAFASQADLVALSGWDDDGGGFVRVYDVKSFALVRHFSTDKALFDVGISPHGTRVAAAGIAATYVWEVESRRRVCELPSSHAIALPLDSPLLLTAELGVIRLWNLELPSPREPGYRHGLSHVAFSPNGDRLVTGSRLVDARSGVPVARLDFKQLDYFEGGPPRNAFVMGDERVVSLEAGVRVWDARTGARLRAAGDRFYHHGHLVAPSPDGLRYALTHEARSEGPDDEGMVEILASESGDELCRLHVPAATCMRWAPDGQTLATGTNDGRVCLWDAARGVLLRTLSGHTSRVSDLGFLRNGAYLIAGSGGDEARIWRTDTGDLVATRKLTSDDPSVETSASTYETWDLTPDTRAAAEDELDALGVADPRDALPWVMTARAGSLALLDRKTREVVAWFPATEHTAAHPHEPIWAGGPVHVRLER